MARPLRETPPSSAVARLLDANAASRAVAQVPDTPHLAQSGILPIPEPVLTRKLNPEPNTLVKREFVLTPETDGILSGLIELYRRSTGARLSGSHLLRSLLVGVEHARPSLEVESRRLGRMKLPGNGRGTEHARMQFERRITAALVAGLRAAATFDPDV